MEAEAPSTR